MDSVAISCNIEVFVHHKFTETIPCGEKTLEVEYMKIHWNEYIQKYIENGISNGRSSYRMYNDNRYLHFGKNKQWKVCT